MENTTLMRIGNSSEIVIYQPDDTIRLEVRMDDETVWLTQAQMAWLFDTTPQNITIHIHNLYKEEELTKSATCKDFLQVQNEGGRSIQRRIKFYNLDVIISVGYRVKSKRGVQFRQWANKVLKEYMIRGYSVNHQLLHLEHRIDLQLQEHSEQIHNLQNQIDFFVRTASTSLSIILLLR